MKENGIPNEVPLSSYVAIIKEVAGYYGLPVLDLFNMSGIQPSVEIIKQKYMDYEAEGYCLSTRSTHRQTKKTLRSVQGKH